MSVQGRDLLTGKPKQVEVSYREIAKVIRHQFKELKMLLWKLQTPPELAAFTIQVFILPVVLCCEDWTKEKQTYLFTLQKILYER
jgi:actin-like ATPase involved in cell morphogenesis